MSTYTAEVLWLRNGEDFLDNRYSRRHVIRFDGGFEIPFSASPHVVPPPMSDTSAVDPEEAFIAALSSCHMLWFLALAAKDGFRVDRYFDAPSGLMGKDAMGKIAMTVVTLKPEAAFSGERVPDRTQIDNMHHEAHEKCFIANSVKTEIRCEPVHIVP